MSAQKTEPVPVALVSLAPSPLTAFLSRLPALVQELFADELDLTGVGDHRAGLDPDLAVEVDVEDTLGLELKQPLAELALGGGVDKTIQRETAGHSGFGHGDLRIRGMRKAGA